MNLIYTEAQLLNRIDQNRTTYIYGAGWVAENLVKRLNRYNKRVQGILTTNGDGVTCGIEAIKFSDALQNLRDTNALIIVAVREGFYDEIYQSLNQAHVSNIDFISNRLACSMERINNLRFKFQTHIVEHCNLKCRGCYHFSSLAKEEYLSVEEYAKDIERLGNLFNRNIEEIFLLGGEPLLHPQLSEFFSATRKSAPNAPVKLLTNGLLLCNMKEDFWTSIIQNNVQLWVTKYPVKFDYDKAEQMAIDRGIKLHYFSKEPVRTLGYQPLTLKGDKDNLKNFVDCYRANECIDLKHGKVYPCIIPAEIKPFNDYFGKNLGVCEADYVDIYDVSTGMELLEKLERPIEFCKYCNRDDISIFGKCAWSSTKYDIKEWVE